MMNNIFDKRRLKTFSNCKDLVKSMVGTRDGVIFYNDKFRLDLENTCYKASMYEDLQQRVDKAKDFCNKQKQKMYKSRNKIALFVLMKLEKILNEAIGE